jgi:hypothetical protein
MWAWIAGIIAVIFAAMLVYGARYHDRQHSDVIEFVNDDRGRPCPEGHPAGARHPGARYSNACDAVARRKPLIAAIGPDRETASSSMEAVFTART